MAVRVCENKPGGLMCTGLEGSTLYQICTLEKITNM